MGLLEEMFAKKTEKNRSRPIKSVLTKESSKRTSETDKENRTNSSTFGFSRNIQGDLGASSSKDESVPKRVHVKKSQDSVRPIDAKPKERRPWFRISPKITKKVKVSSAVTKSTDVELRKNRSSSLPSKSNVTSIRGQNPKLEGDDLSRTSSVTNLEAEQRSSKGAKPRKSSSRDRIDKIVDSRKNDKKGLTKNNNKLEGNETPFLSLDSTIEEDIQQLKRQLQEMAQEKTNLALQLGEKNGQVNFLQKENYKLKSLQEECNLQLEKLAEDNTALRNRLRDVAHSPLSDNEKQQLLFESHRHHNSAPASIATNILDEGNGGDTTCTTPDWDKHSSGNISEVSVACLQDKINQMQETHYSTNEELQATLQELTDLQMQLTELRQENERLNEEKTLMFDSLCRQTERLNDSRNELESLKQHLYQEKDRGDFEVAAEREQKLVDLLKTVQEERESLAQQVDRLDGERREASEGAAAQEGALERSRERVRTLESALTAKQAEIKEWEGELARARDQLNGRQIEVNRLKDLLDNARTKIVELEQDRTLSDKSELDELLDNARKEKDSLESEVAHLKEQLAIGKNEIEKLKEQVSVLREECKVMRNNAKTTQSDLEYKCEKLQKEKNALADQLQEFQEALNELQVQSQCQLEDKRQLSAVLSETQRNLSEAERRNLNLEHEFEELKKTRDEENEEWEKFQDDLLTSVRVANDFKTEAQQELQRLILENKSCRERERQLKAEIEKLKGSTVKKEEIAMDAFIKRPNRTKDKPRHSKDSSGTQSSSSKSQKSEPDTIKKPSRKLSREKRLKTLSVEEETLLKSLRSYNIDHNIPEANLTEEEKVIKKLKIIFEDDFLRIKPVAPKPKNQLAISKPLLDSVLTNPKLLGIINDPKVKTVDDMVAFEQATPEVRKLIRDIDRTRAKSEHFQGSSKKISVIGRSYSNGDVNQLENDSHLLYRTVEAEDLTRDVVLTAPSVAPSDSASERRYSDFSVVVHRTESKVSFATLEGIARSIPADAPDFLLSKEEKFARRLLHALEEEKRTLRRIKNAKKMAISKPTLASVINNPKLKEVMLDPEVSLVQRRNSDTPMPQESVAGLRQSKSFDDINFVFDNDTVSTEIQPSRCSDSSTDTFSSAEFNLDTGMTGPYDSQAFKSAKLKDLSALNREKFDDSMDKKQPDEAGKKITESCTDTNSPVILKIDLLQEKIRKATMKNKASTELNLDKSKGCLPKSLDINNKFDSLRYNETVDYRKKYSKTDTAVKEPSDLRETGAMRKISNAHAEYLVVVPTSFADVIEDNAKDNLVPDELQKMNQLERAHSGQYDSLTYNATINKRQVESEKISSSNEKEDEVEYYRQSDEVESFNQHDASIENYQFVNERILEDKVEIVDGKIDDMARDVSESNGDRVTSIVDRVEQENGDGEIRNRTDISRQLESEEILNLDIEEVLNEYNPMKNQLKKLTTNESNTDNTIEYDYQTISKENRYGVVTPLNYRQTYKNVVKQIKEKYGLNQVEEKLAESDSEGDGNSSFDDFFKSTDITKSDSVQVRRNSADRIDEDMEYIFSKYLHTRISGIIKQSEPKHESNPIEDSPVIKASPIPKPRNLEKHSNPNIQKPTEMITEANELPALPPLPEKLLFEDIDIVKEEYPAKDIVVKEVKNLDTLPIVWETAKEHNAKEIVDGIKVHKNSIIIDEEKLNTTFQQPIEVITETNELYASPTLPEKLLFEDTDTLEGKNPPTNIVVEQVENLDTMPILWKSAIEHNAKEIVDFIEEHKLTNSTIFDEEKLNAKYQQPIEVITLANELPVLPTLPEKIFFENTDILEEKNHTKDIVIEKFDNLDTMPTECESVINHNTKETFNCIELNKSTNSTLVDADRLNLKNQKSIEVITGNNELPVLPTIPEKFLVEDINIVEGDSIIDIVVDDVDCIEENESTYSTIADEGRLGLTAEEVELVEKVKKQRSERPLSEVNEDDLEFIRRMSLNYLSAASLQNLSAIPQNSLEFSEEEHSYVDLLDLNVTSKEGDFREVEEHSRRLSSTEDIDEIVGITIIEKSSNDIENLNEEEKLSAIKSSDESFKIVEDSSFTTVGNQTKSSIETVIGADIAKNQNIPNPPPIPRNIDTDNVIKDKGSGKNERRKTFTFHKSETPDDLDAILRRMVTTTKTRITGRRSLNLDNHATKGNEAMDLQQKVLPGAAKYKTDNTDGVLLRQTAPTTTSRYSTRDRPLSGTKKVKSFAQHFEKLSEEGKRKQDPVSAENKPVTTRNKNQVTQVTADNSPLKQDPVSSGSKPLTASNKDQITEATNKSVKNDGLANDQMNERSRRKQDPVSSKPLTASNKDQVTTITVTSTDNSLVKDDGLAIDKMNENTLSEESRRMQDPVSSGSKPLTASNKDQITEATDKSPVKNDGLANNKMNERSRRKQDPVSSKPLTASNKDQVTTITVTSTDNTLVKDDGLAINKMNENVLSEKSRRKQDPVSSGSKPLTASNKDQITEATDKSPVKNDGLANDKMNERSRRKQDPVSSKSLTASNKDQVTTITVTSTDNSLVKDGGLAIDKMNEYALSEESRRKQDPVSSGSKPLTASNKDQITEATDKSPVKNDGLANDKINEWSRRKQDPVSSKPLTASNKDQVTTITVTTTDNSLVKDDGLAIDTMNENAKLFCADEHDLVQGKSVFEVPPSEEPDVKMEVPDAKMEVPKGDEVDQLVIGEMGHNGAEEASVSSAVKMQVDVEEDQACGVSKAELSLSSIEIAEKFEKLDLTRPSTNIAVDEITEANASHLNLFNMDASSCDESYLNLFKSPEEKMFDAFAKKKAKKGYLNVAYLGEPSDDENEVHNSEGNPPKIIDFVPLDEATQPVYAKDLSSYDTLERENTFQVLSKAASAAKIAPVLSKESKRSSFSDAKKVFEALQAKIEPGTSKTKLNETLSVSEVGGSSKGGFVRNSIDKFGK